MSENNLSEEYSKIQKNSFGVAKRIIILSELFIVSGTNGFLSLILFLILSLGTSGVAHFIGGDFSKESFNLRGGLFIYLCVVFMNLFAVTGIWYALCFLRLQLQCKNLDTVLDGASEVNSAANDGDQSAAAAGPIAVAHIYLIKNGMPVPDHKIFVCMKNILYFVQMIIAVVSFIMWMNWGG